MTFYHKFFYIARTFFLVYLAVSWRKAEAARDFDMRRFFGRKKGNTCGFCCAQAVQRGWESMEPEEMKKSIESRGTIPKKADLFPNEGFLRRRY
ncbi:MAG: hypothetical protein KIC79_07850 [Firmicutes bacterium]|nr:hypothetical protein [Bacillota bacterium]